MKYNIKELYEKLNMRSNIPLEEINPGDVDNLSDIKISRNKIPQERILEKLKIHMYLK